MNMKYSLKQRLLLSSIFYSVVKDGVIHSVVQKD
jgi:hypothetical protein